MPIHKWFFRPISALCSKNNPRNIKYMPVVIFFECLDLKRKSSFMDGHKSGPILAKNRIYLQTEGAPFAIHLVTIYHSHLKTIQITFGSLNASNQSYDIEKAFFFRTVTDMIGCSHRYFFDSFWVVTTVQCISIGFYQYISCWFCALQFLCAAINHGFSKRSR